MRFGWLLAWWDQIRGRPPVDPWNDDPEIKRERDRQHRDGVTDGATAYRIQQQLRERRIDAQTEAWRRNVYE